MLGNPRIVYTWPKKWIFTKFIMVGCILLLLMATLFYSTYASMSLSGCRVRQMAITQALKERLESGREIPQTVTDLSAIEFTNAGQKLPIYPNVNFEAKHNGLKYYPDAWDKPDSILLQSSVCGLYVVTFGKGSQAVLQTWSYRTLSPEVTHIGRGVDSLDTRYIGPPCAMGALLFSLLCILVIVLIIGPRRGAQPSCSSQDAKTSRTPTL